VSECGRLCHGDGSRRTGRLSPTVAGGCWRWISSMPPRRPRGQPLHPIYPVASSQPFRTLAGRQSPTYRAIAIANPMFTGIPSRDGGQASARCRRSGASGSRALAGTPCLRAGRAGGFPLRRPAALDRHHFESARRGADPRASLPCPCAPAVRSSSARGHGRHRPIVRTSRLGVGAALALCPDARRA